MSIDRIFEALASRPRREILAYLSAQELTAGQIGERFAMSAPAISRHLSVLSAAGLVSSERRGQFVVYRLTPDNMVNTLSGFAFEVCPKAGPLQRESRKRAKKPLNPFTDFCCEDMPWTTNGSSQKQVSRVYHSPPTAAAARWK